MEDLLVPCRKCTQKVPITYFKVHTKYCIGRALISPVIAQLLYSRILFSVQAEKVLRQDQDPHCPHCSVSLKQQEVSKHGFVCSKMPIRCSYCCQSVAAQEMAPHLQTCLQQYSKSFIEMKENCCHKFSQDQDKSEMNTETEFLLEQLIKALRLKIYPSRMPNPHSETRVFIQQLGGDLCKQHTQCSFCKVDFVQKEEIQQIQCCHKFHRKCLGIWTWKARQCPQCKQEIVP